MTDSSYLSDLDRARLRSILLRRVETWRGLGRDRLDWDDCEQEAAIAICEAEARFVPGRGMTLFSWCYSKAPQMLIDRGRRTKRLDNHRPPATQGIRYALPLLTFDSETDITAIPIGVYDSTIIDLDAETEITAVDDRLDACGLVPVIAEAARQYRDVRALLAYTATCNQYQVAADWGCSPARISQLVKQGRTRLTALLAA